jgi:hypothetical protein
MQWYYARDGQTHGPLDDAELARLARVGALRPRDHVWNETMGDTWAEASTIPELFPAAGTRRAADTTRPLAAEPAYASGVISCTAPVGRAWAGMRAILFRPFDLRKWFGLGFTAWLATLGEGGGSANVGNPAEHDGAQSWRTAVDTWHTRVLPFLQEHAAMIGMSVVAAVVVIVGLSMLILWIKSRGRFMFLDNVVNDRAEVQHPWRVFAQHGTSLFWWTFVYGLVCVLVAVLLLALTVASAVQPCLRAGQFTPAAVPGMIVCGLLWIVFGTVTAYIGRFLNDFIVPIMYRHDLTAREAWGRFLPLFRAHAGGFIVYGLMVLLLAITAGIAILGVVVITCCLAGCIMAIPYVGTVFLLPVPVFFRLYSLEYLEQYGPEFTMQPDA